MNDLVVYLGSGLLVGISAGLSPGPLMALVIRETLNRDARAGIRVAMAPLVTDLPIIIITIFMTRLISVVHSYLGVITLAGSFYLFYLAWESFKPGLRRYDQPENGKQSLKKGIFANFLNPAPYLFWITLGAPSLLNMWEKNRIYPFIYVAGFYLCLVGSKVIFALVLGKMKDRINYRYLHYIHYLLGLSLVIFGILFLWDGIGMVKSGM